MALAAPRVAAEPPARPPAVTMVRSEQPEPFGQVAAPKAEYAKGAEGTAALRKVLLDPDTTDAIREDAFYQLSLRGEAAAPVLLELRPFVEKNPRWQLVYAQTLAGVPDRRLIHELLRLARQGNTPGIRAIALGGLSLDLSNRRISTTTRHADGSVTTAGYLSAVVCGPVRSLGIPLGNGDEKPIKTYLKELQASTDPWTLRTMRDLGWQVKHPELDPTSPPPNHARRMSEARRLAISIPVGTTRAQVEKVFTRPDGGLSGPSASRYFMGDEVMVEVPYDQTGGAWKPTNRVNGPIKVYRDDMHSD
jgi:hypothetical protein